MEAGRTALNILTSKPAARSFLGRGGLENFWLS
jgi:hypothetical protein